MSDGGGRWPTFLVIGAARAGTTSVHGLLRQHPRVFVPPIKEPNFFALRAMGVDLDALPPEQRAPWGHAVTDPERYRSLFASPPAAGSRPEFAGVPEQSELCEGGAEPLAFGECSPVYLAVPGTAEQICATIPDVRLIAILRDPVDRAISHHAHNLSTGAEQHADFSTALKHDVSRGVHSNYYRQGFYAMLLAPYVECFGKGRLLLLDQSELAADAAAFMDRIFEHIGVARGVPLRVPEPALATKPAHVEPDVRSGLAQQYRGDTRRLVVEFGFELARNWSSY